MQTQKVSRTSNITNRDELCAAIATGRLSVGDRVHIGVCGPGQMTDDATFDGECSLAGDEGVWLRVLTLGRTTTVRTNVSWGDIIEFWPIDTLTKAPR